jgi:uncharacterized membrane protein
MFPDALFLTFYIMIFILATVSYVISLLRSRKSNVQAQRQPSAQTEPATKEREIIREIVKIRCPYCGNLYDEKEDKCPCYGGKQS